ncbi:hypothetical protein R1sor_011281 [Riccia sorocarpa]|uniref:Uncharacterized protein n=1 Tax=Riccia sorocarpa TaxID=122646 RepID=A0ABD3I4B5_9MARC
MAAIMKMFSSSKSSSPRSETSSSRPKTPESTDSAAATSPAAVAYSESEPKTPETPKRNAINDYFSALADSIVNVPPYLGRARVPEVCRWRDKEALLGEIIDLRNALSRSEIHLAEHKHEYIRRLAENRKLERRVEELELRGNYDAPRSGGVVRLEAKVKGKTQTSPLTVVCLRNGRLETQYTLVTDMVATRKHGELYELSRDINATRTRETEVERDTYAAEIGRLKILLQHMKMLYLQTQMENGDYIMCKRHLEKCLVVNPRLQLTVQSLQESVKRAEAQLKAQKAKADAAKSTAKKLEGKFASLQSQLQSLASQIESAEKYKQKRQRKLQQIGFERMKFNRDAKEHAIASVQPASTAGNAH